MDGEKPTSQHEPDRTITNVQSWMGRNRLILNGDNSQIIVYSNPRNPISITSAILGDAVIEPSTLVCNLDVMYNSTLTFEQHITRTIQAGSYHLRNIGRIRILINRDAVKSLIQALVISRLDYGNCLLAGLPDNQLTKLQLG